MASQSTDENNNASTPSTAPDDLLVPLTQQPPFRLFDLPAELRLRIYGYALCPTTTVHFPLSAADAYKPSPTLVPNLLRTCRRVENEAGDLLYSDNEIYLDVCPYRNTLRIDESSGSVGFLLRDAHHLWKHVVLVVNPTRQCQSSKWPFALPAVQTCTVLGIGQESVRTTSSQAAVEHGVAIDELRDRVHLGQAVRRLQPEDREEHVVELVPARNDGIVWIRVSILMRMLGFASIQRLLMSYRYEDEDGADDGDGAILILARAYT
jgi:hypothetical protein